MHQLTFEGNKDIKTEDLEDSLNNIGFKIGRNYDPSILDEIERSLIDQYFSFGKYNARVKTTVEELPGNTVGVQVDVSEGDRAQIRQINVVGNKIFSDEDILERLKLQMPNWLSFLTKMTDILVKISQETLRQLKISISIRVMQILGLNQRR